MNSVIMERIIMNQGSFSTQSMPGDHPGQAQTYAPQPGYLSQTYAGNDPTNLVPGSGYPELPLGEETRVQIVSASPKKGGEAFVLKMKCLSGSMCGAEINSYFGRYYKNGKENAATARLFKSYLGDQSSVNESEMRLVGAIYHLTRMKTVNGYDKITNIYVPRDAGAPQAAPQAPQYQAIPQAVPQIAPQAPQQAPSASHYQGDIPF